MRVHTNNIFRKNNFIFNPAKKASLTASDFLPAAFDIARGQPFGELCRIIAVMIMQRRVEFLARIERIFDNRFGVGAAGSGFCFDV